MIAIVPAAGRGTRLGPLTAQRPKALVPVAGRPVLFWAIEGLAAAGASEVVVVTGHLGDQIERVLLDAPLPVTTVRQEAPRGTADALMAAADWAEGSRFLYAWGDVVTDPRSYRQVVDAWSGGGAVLAVDRVDDPASGAAVSVGHGGSVTAIVEKPSPGTSATPFNAAGIGALPAIAWEYLAAVRPSVRGELEITSALAAMLSAGVPLTAVEIGPVFDIGTPQGLATAEAWAAEPDHPL